VGLDAELLERLDLMEHLITDVTGGDFPLNDTINEKVFHGDSLIPP